MNPLTRPVRCYCGLTSLSTVLSLLLIIGSYFVAGCGSSGMSSGTTPPPPLSPTSVAMVVSSTANSQFSSFYVDVTSITFTNQAGTAVTVLAAPQSNAPFSQIQEAEFIHLNGQTAPFLTAMVPQDTYTSARLTYSFAEFTTVQLGTAGGIELVNDATGGPTAASQVASVILPAPLTIHGNAMTVALDLQAPASVTVPTQGPGQPPYLITPTFTLTAVAPGSKSQVQVRGVDGLVSSISSGSNSLSLMIAYGFNNPSYPDGATFTVATNTSTVYQGVGNFAALAAGMIANMDIAIQSDGSLLATRIEVDDPAATNVLIGPLGTVFATQNEILQLGRTNEEFNQQKVPATSWNYTFDASIAFKLSGQIALPSNLPFSTTFDGSHMIAGQNVAVASQAIVTFGGILTHATTITLMPQTINGTIAGVSSNGGFTVYSVSLAARDLFPTLAVQSGQTTVLQSPSIVEVYVNSSTQMLNSMGIAPGNVLRFNGLIFNDNGTARMVASQVNDGVAE